MTLLMRYGITYTTVGGAPEEIKAVKDALTFPVMTLEDAFAHQRARGEVKVHRGGETATFSLFNSQLSCFPSGLTNHVLSSIPFRPQVWDETGCRYGQGADKIKPDMLKGVELREYQMDAARIALHYRRGFIQHSTGSGKTEVCAAILSALDDVEYPVLFLVNTKFLLEQAASRFAERGLGPVAVYGGGVKEVCRGINVATVQGFTRDLAGGDARAKWLADNVVSLVLDESHHAGNQTSYNAGMALLRARNRWGLTMQVEELPGVFNPFDMHTVGVIGPVIHEISPSYLRSRGWQSNPALVVMSTFGDTVWQSGWPDVYEEGIIRHRQRNSYDALLAQAAHRAGRKTLLFVWQITHGLALLDTLRYLEVPALFCSGGGVVQRFNGSQLVTEKWPFGKIQEYVDDPGGRVVIGTSVIDEGADLPQTDILILSVAGKAFRRLRQRIGRGLRPKGSSYTVVFDHQDGHNEKLAEHSAMRQHVWRYDSIPFITGGDVEKYAGFALPEYRDCYCVPASKNPLVPSSVPGMSARAPMGLS